MPKKMPFLKVSDARIVDESGKPVTLRGVALGGWLMMEGYMTGGRNIAERTFRAGFGKALGPEALADFTRSFRNAFIREEDIETIKSWGANCIRIPFNYRLIEYEDRPFSLDHEGLEYLDRAVGWCEKHSLYCVLDMHAVPGAQNQDWHADCDGKPEFFSSEANIDRYLRLWYFLAGRYRDAGAVAGYDILNEPVVPLQDERIVRDVYVRAIKEIRDTGDRHIIFLEGNVWAQRIDFLGAMADRNTVYSVHAYPPIDFTFNLEKDLRYPGRAQGFLWNRKKLELLAAPYRIFTDLVKKPLYVGEFGVNARDNVNGEIDWVKDAASIFNKNGFHWTYWTYKTVANATYPDGIFRYTKNPPWVNRQGPAYGWETFASVWMRDKDRMIESWRTANFTVNEKLLAVLKEHW
jgi:aryl-phospho-beta-D-glucosidase BglC (GH1 family)